MKSVLVVIVFLAGAAAAHAQGSAASPSPAPGSPSVSDSWAPAAAPGEAPPPQGPEAVPPGAPLPDYSAPHEPPPPAYAPPPPAYAPPPPGYGPPPAPLPGGAHRAQAGELCYPAPPPGRTHDGFYAHLNVGGGYMTARNGNTTMSGGQFGFGFALGAVIVPNLALFGTFFFHFADAPTITTDGASTHISGSTLENDSFGAGAAYYIQPFNAYVAAAVTGTQVMLVDKDENPLVSSNTGTGFQAMVGKEWWVGTEWGLGVAGEITGAWMKDHDDPNLRWTSFTYTLEFSATYN